MKRDSLSLIVNILLTYTYTFPLHFIAKVKVKKEKEEICCVQCFHVKILTPDNYDLNFKERSIVEPFKECGFKTYTIVSETNLLSYEKYLSNGVDSLIIVPNIVQDGEIVMGDKTMVHIVDSLMQLHDKLFIMMQFLGNHSFFTNYEKEFDIYRPNAYSCTDEERMTSDSLLINAYDNNPTYIEIAISNSVSKYLAVTIFFLDTGNVSVYTS